MKSELFKDASAQFINATLVPARVIDRAVDGANPPVIAALQKSTGSRRSSLVGGRAGDSRSCRAMPAAPRR